MIVPIFVLISSILFLAGFFKLIKLPNSSKKLILLLKPSIYSSPASPLHPNTSSPKEISMSMNKDEAQIRQVFDTFDKNGDGFITRNELRESLKNIGILVPPKEVEEMMNTLDSNSDGLIDLGEFNKLFELVESRDKGKIQEENKGCFNDDGDDEDLKEAFDVFDGDKDGLISVQELGLVLSSLGLKEGKREEDCKEMIRKVDVDGDGMVNFDEFKRMMRGGIGFGGASNLVYAF